MIYGITPSEEKIKEIGSNLKSQILTQRPYSSSKKKIPPYTLIINAKVKCDQNLHIREALKALT